MLFDDPIEGRWPKVGPQCPSFRECPPGCLGTHPNSRRRLNDLFKGASFSCRSETGKPRQRRSQPQDRHLRSETPPGAPGESMFGARTKDFASRGPRNLRSRGTLPPQKETLYVVRRCTTRQITRWPLILCARSSLGGCWGFQGDASGALRSPADRRPSREIRYQTILGIC